MQRKGTSRIALLLTGVSSLVGATVFSGSIASAAHSQNAPRTLTPIPFTVSINQASGITMDLVWAQERGLFNAVGLNVNIDYTGSIGTTEVAAGSIVVGQAGSSSTISPTAQGHAEENIYTDATGATSQNILVQNTSTAHSLMDLSGETMAAQGAGTGTYGSAQLYSAYIVKHGGQALKIVPFSNASTESAALIAGSVQSAVGVKDNYATAIDGGKIRVLLNGDSSTVRGLFGKTAATSGFFGLASALQSNKTAVTRFVAGMRLADYEIRQQSNQALGSVLAQIPAESTINSGVLSQTIGWDRPFFTKTDGYITRAAWGESLRDFAYYGLGSNMFTAPFSYASIVDMSYWNGATPIIRKLCNSKHPAIANVACTQFKKNPMA